LTEQPALAPLRRVTWGTALQTALLTLAAIAVLRFVAKVDFGEVRDDLADAHWGWVVLAFVVAQLPRLTQALGALGSIAADVRYGPLYVLQLATSYLNLALPSALARMTVFIRFFQRQGLTGAEAVTAGAIDSFAGNVLQGIIVVALLLFSSAEFSLDLSAPSGGARTLLWVLIGLAVLAVAVTALVRRFRRSVMDRVRAWLPQVRRSLRPLRTPKRIALLIGGNLATELLFAFALSLMARGFGSHIGFAELLLINSGTSLLSSLIPVPGGIGIVEFSLEVGLTSTGMTASAAAATILLYRLATFYLPPVWGFFAFRWLQRKQYL